MQEIKRRLQKQVLIYDGAVGTMLFKMGLPSGECPERWNLLSPKKIAKVHKAYINAGADIIETNTFGGNRLALEKYALDDRLEEINRSGVEIAKESAGKRVYVAASVGPLPKMLEPLGELSFDDAKNIFQEQIKALLLGKPDLILFETFSDILELKSAIIAAREITQIPIQAQLTYSEGGSTLSGTPPEVAAVVLESLGVDIVGVNCSLGPEELVSIVEKLCNNLPSHIYISVLPNAGLPQIENGKTVYKYSPEKFAKYCEKFYQLGVNLIGGCCGTTPSHIKAIAKRLKRKKPICRNVREFNLRLASRTRVVELDPAKSPYVIGERINPTRRKVLKEQLIRGQTTIVREDAIKQVASGADLLDINVSIPEVDEVSLMKKVIQSVQTAVDVPLVIDSPNPTVIESALKVYAGKPLVNSVNGEKEKMAEILPLAKKYGASVIGLTMDEKGIPMDISSRIRVARKIFNKARSIGIPVREIIIDFLTLTCGAQPESIKVTLKCIEKAGKYNWYTVLGVSNVSFGLPNREEINASFLSMAVGCGLTCAIINPLSDRIKQTIEAIKRLFGIEAILKKDIFEVEERYKEECSQKLYESILLGDRDNVERYVKACLGYGLEPLKINHDILMPALEEVGKRFEKGTYFLPHLLLAAESMEKAVKILETRLEKRSDPKRGKIIMATVKGDLHDIGKNIVSTVLRNYGYEVIDLGKDVPSEKIIEEAKRIKPDAVGLSALMTTTMGQMEVVINELKRHGIDVHTIVGGAVVSASYAKKIGAAGYAKDAVEAVSLLDKLIKKKV